MDKTIWFVYIPVCLLSFFACICIEKEMSASSLKLMKKCSEQNTKDNKIILSLKEETFKPLPGICPTNVLCDNVKY